MEIILPDDFKEKLKIIVDHFDPESNEATRTHKIIARVLNALEDLSCLEYTYVANQTNHGGKRPDFLLSHKDKEFFIVEAKAGLHGKHQEQIIDYLKSHSISHGCLSDGVMWSMYVWDGSKLNLDRNIIINDAQGIVDYIVSKV
ncbi:MAG: hypothetical protein HRU19_32630 [Pseudobacteriovorax sp.]|nr:hypothetical protein [Pseudobacteriovorax sp.]